jgi:hypothetical protein
VNGRTTAVCGDCHPDARAVAALWAFLHPSPEIGEIVGDFPTWCRGYTGRALPEVVVRRYAARELDRARRHAGETCTAARERRYMPVDSGDLAILRIAGEETDRILADLAAEVSSPNAATYRAFASFARAHGVGLEASPPSALVAAWPGYALAHDRDARPIPHYIVAGEVIRAMKAGRAAAAKGTPAEVPGEIAVILCAIDAHFGVAA